MSSRDSGRLAFLDVIRGLAALAVVVQHGLERFAPGYLPWSLRHVNLGAFGVTAFFLVSGFIIPYSLERSGSLKVFWLGRLFRLYPLYWASLAAAVVLGVAGLAPLPAGAREALPRFVLANATMFQEWVRVPHAIGVYWTLSMEMVFYVLCAALFFLGWNKRSLLWAWAALGAMVAGTVGLALVLHRDLPAGRVGLIVSAFAGTALCRHFFGELHARKVVPLFAATLAGFALCFWLHFDKLASATRTLDWSFGAVLTSWVLAYAFVLALYALRGRTFPLALRWLGRVSYSLYLVHPLVLDALPGAGPAALRLVEFVGASVLVSGLSYAAIEQPCIDLGKQLASRLRKPAPAVAAGSAP